MPKVSKETATQIAVEHVKLQKNTADVDVAMIEDSDFGWIIQGTCPINLEGHQWAQKFEVIVDPKGKVRAADFSLL